MTTGPASSPHSTETDDLGALVMSWRRLPAARRASPRTIATCSTAVAQLAAYLAPAEPSRVGHIRREHAEAWITDPLARRAPTTAHNRFRGVAPGSASSRMGREPGVREVTWFVSEPRQRLQRR